jgi:hypothetical protein
VEDDDDLELAPVLSSSPSPMASYPMLFGRPSEVAAPPAFSDELRPPINISPANDGRASDSLTYEDYKAADKKANEGAKVDTAPFLIGEEALDEVRLSDGKKIFINDVLETAEWCVLCKCSIYTQLEQTLSLGQSRESYRTIIPSSSKNSISSRLSTNGTTLRTHCSIPLPIS